MYIMEGEWLHYKFPLAKWRVVRLNFETGFAYSMNRFHFVDDVYVIS